MERARLIVKNFGPLKDIDIKVREMVCIIGKQASGKSTLAKLIAIFEDFEIGLKSFEFKKELKKYNLISYLNSNTLIKYDNYFNGNQFEFEKDKTIVNNTFFSIFKKLPYDISIENFNRKVLFIDKKIVTKDLKKESIEDLNSVSKKIFKQVINKFKEFDKNSELDLINDTKKYNFLAELFLSFLFKSVFINTERNFLNLIVGNTLGLINNNISIPQHILELGQEYEKALKSITNFSLNEINLEYTYKSENGISYIYYNQNERVLLSQSASGIQSLIPLILIVYYKNTINQTFGINYGFNFIIEEPELNLYPETQHNLIKHLVANCLDDITQGKNLVLTTHSPYVLSSINNLLMAYKKGQEKSKEVQKIIKKKSWLDPNRFAAYEMRNGKAYSIVNKRQGLIKENMIDSVVEIFDNEFTRLLNL